MFEYPTPVVVVVQVPSKRSYPSACFLLWYLPLRYLVNLLVVRSSCSSRWCLIRLTFQFIGTMGILPLNVAQPAFRVYVPLGHSVPFGHGVGTVVIIMVVTMFFVFVA